MARGSEDQFLAILSELHKNTKNYEDKKIKHYQWAGHIDDLFASYTWTKAEFYKELNARLGIETNETREKKKREKKPVKGEKKSVKKKASVSSVALAPPRYDYDD